MPDAPPAAQPDDSAVVDFFQEIATWLGERLNSIIRVLVDVESADVVLAEIGWEGSTPVLPAELLQRLDAKEQAGADPNVQSGESFAEVLVAILALADAFHAVSDLQDGESAATAAAEVVADLLDIVMVLWLRQKHPGVWALLRFTNILVDDGSRYGPQLDNFLELFSDLYGFVDSLVHWRTSSAEHYLGDLTKDPGQIVAPTFGGPSYVQDYADYSVLLAAVGSVLEYTVKPVPRAGEHDWSDPHGHDVDAFSMDVLYGWAPASLDELDPSKPDNPYPHLMELLTRMLTVRLDVQQKAAGAHVKIDLTVALVPPEHNGGHFGVYVSLAGVEGIDFPFANKWELTISTTATPPIELLLGTGGFVRGAASGYQTTIAVERPADVTGSAILGDPKSSHVEIQHARVALVITDDDQRGWLFDFGVHSDHVIVDIELGNDSFISHVLPPSIRLDTKLGAGVELGDKGRGFYLDGGVALVMDLPVDITIGPAGIGAIVIQGLHLRVGVTRAPAGSGGSGAALALSFTIDAAARIAGVLTFSVAGVGMQYGMDQTQAGAGATGGSTAGHWHPSRGGVPPKGVGILVSANPVHGGGYLGFDSTTGEYTGAFQLALGGGLGLSGIGLVETKIPGHDGQWSLLAILALTFRPGQPLWGGVSLAAVGIVLGYNRTIDSDAIAAGLRTKALDTILFPPDPVVQAPHIFSVWRQTMPYTDGQYVVGIMAELVWVSEDLCQLDLAVLVTAPNPTEIVLLGSLRLYAPDEHAPLMRLRVDAVGRLRFDPLDFLLQGELVDSKLGTFPIGGGAVVALRSGVYLLSVGGFNPHFTPPANVPVADRIRIDLSSGNNPRIRFDGYAAITSQTVQLGARLELHAAAGPLAVDGWLGFDGLIQWDPRFQLSVEIAAGLSLSFDGSPLMEISIDVLFEGPGPWHVHGYASLSLLFFTLSLPFDHSWGDAGPATATATDPLALVRAALSVPAAWSAPPPAGSPLVVLRPATGTAIPAHPLAVVSCRERVVPLGLQITDVGNQPLAAPTTVDVTGLTLGGAPVPAVEPVTEAFAAGQFLTLTDDERLSRPSFEPMRAGLSVAGDSVDGGNATVVATSYKTIAVDGTTRTARPPLPLALAHADAVLRPPAPPTARPIPVPLVTVPDTLRSIAGETAAPETASLAAQHAGSQRLYDLVGVAGGSA